MGAPCGFEGPISRSVYSIARRMAGMLSFPRLCQRVIAHWRTIVLVLILAPGAFYVIHPDELSLLLALLLIFIASQIFWIGRVVVLGEWLLPRRVWRRRVAMGVVLAYLFVVAYSFPTTIAQGPTFRIGFYRLPVIVTEAVFWWWFVGSMLAFLLVIVFGLLDRVVRAAAWTYRKIRKGAQQRVSGDSETAPSSPSRRQFLQRTAVLVSATQGYFMSGRMWKWCGTASGWRACPRLSTDFASPSFPTSTWVPSPQRATSVVASRSLTA